MYLYRNHNWGQHCSGVLAPPFVFELLPCYILPKIHIFQAAPANQKDNHCIILENVEKPLTLMMLLRKAIHVIFPVSCQANTCMGEMQC